jgi:hypothetical protein
VEAAAPFTDTALAQDDDLFAAPQRVHDHGPFFEGNLHGKKLGEGRRVVSAQFSVFSEIASCQWLTVHQGRRI